MKKSKLVVIILTHNEEIHLPRCIQNVKKISNCIYVVDSYSSDRTEVIARKYKVNFLRHKWYNHSFQFNWALTRIPKNSEWVMRIDADEIISNELIIEINKYLRSLDPKITGIFIPRRINFLGNKIRFGGIFPSLILRVFRYGYGKCDGKFMDEHIEVSGLTHKFNGEIIDDNLNSLSWWIDKHNKYASLEAIQYLIQGKSLDKYSILEDFLSFCGFMPKKFSSKKIYYKFPSRLRAIFYFIYRYFLRFGFLDGRAGFDFHFLHSVWYRSLVDMKINEIERCMSKKEITLDAAAKKIFGITFRKMK